MSRGPLLPPGHFRLFGNPITLQTQQMVTYLHAMKLPFTPYTSHALVSYFAAMFYRAADGMNTTLSPDRVSLVTTLDLIEYCEPRVREAPPLATLDAVTHPRLKVVHNFLMAYSFWWLMCIGGYYRWTHGEGSAMGAAHAQFFMFSGVSRIAKGLFSAMRGPMRQTLVRYGVSSLTAPYIQGHFERLCLLLDEHFKKHQYILGTPKPTALDTVMGASFNGQFLKDTDSRKYIVDSEFESLMRWAKQIEPTFEGEGEKLNSDVLAGVEGENEEATAKPQQLAVDARGRRRRVSADRKSKMRELQGEADQAVQQPVAASGPMVDAVPDTLEPVLELAADVMPWMVSQADAMRLWHQQAGQPTEKVTLPKNIFGVEPGLQVTAHSVPRLLEQSWSLAVEDLVVECDVSVFHVALAQRLAQGVASVDLNSSARVAPVEESTVLPVEAYEHLHELLQRCDPCLMIRPVTVMGNRSKYAIWSVDGASTASPQGTDDATSSRME